MKYIFVVGGVVSGIGKGITGSSIGMLLRSRGYEVVQQKFDPYINVDPGTMNPTQHGEVYVTDDGFETDLDLGHYERFTGAALDRRSSVTMGQIYEAVISKERRGVYAGQTVQVIPHITDEIKSRFFRDESDTDDRKIAIIEIGGTIGDIESQPFFEAIRQFRREVGEGNSLIVVTTLIPYLKAAGELKTKPTQQAVRTLQSMGLYADIIVARCEKPIPRSVREKISMFCDVPVEAIVDNSNCRTVYEVPLMLERQGIAKQVLKRLHLPDTEGHHEDWDAMVESILHPQGKVEIALVGKYTGLHDAYLSVSEAITHAGAAFKTQVNIRWIDAEKLVEEDPADFLSDIDGIIVPGGFGKRGSEGMIRAIEYAREHSIPFLGICLGMQMACVEFARDVLGYRDADSTEFNSETSHPIIDLMTDQRGLKSLGGTMRLGSYPCHLKEGSLAYHLYGTSDITERHRHRYEFNGIYRDEFERHGMVVSGIYPDRDIVEMVEIPDHPFFIATQAHPEFKSRLTSSHPLFRGLVEAAIDRKQSREG